jgi:hypothetical protein
MISCGKRSRTKKSLRTGGAGNLDDGSGRRRLGSLPWRSRSVAPSAPSQWVVPKLQDARVVFNDFAQAHHICFTHLARPRRIVMKLPPAIPGIVRYVRDPISTAEDMPIRDDRHIGRIAKFPFSHAVAHLF